MAVDGSLYHTEVVNEHGLTGESYVMFVVTKVWL